MSVQNGVFMKKISHVVILIILAISLSGCLSEQPSELPTEKNDFNESLNIDKNAEIALFNNENLFYFTSETNEETPDLTTMILYEYNFVDQKSKELSSYEDVSIYSGSKVLQGEKLYLPLTHNTDNILAEVNLENNSSKIIKQWETNPPLAFVYGLNQNIILFGPNTLEDSTFEYAIDTFNPDNNKETNLVNTEVKDQQGELIPTIDVEGDYIYALSITVQQNEHQYQIIKYDKNGKQISMYPFDLKAYFNPSATLVDQDDAIYRLYKEQDYFILNTLNGRVFIFKLVNNNLQPVPIPKEFYKENPSGFRFIEYYDGESDFGYFYNTFDHKNVITVFNYLTEEITTFDFPEDKSNYFYFRNAKGDLIVHKSNDEGLSEFNYYNVESLTKNK